MEEKLPRSTLNIFSLTKDFLNKIITKIVGEPFKSTEDISLENLGDFLIPILNNYKEGTLDYATLGNISNALQIVIHRKYMDDYPDTCYPILPEEDKRFIPLQVISYIDIVTGKFILFPEDVSHFMEALRAAPGKEKEYYEKLTAYAASFDFEQRLKEAKIRGILL